jgi:hypothetical protein
MRDETKRQTLLNGRSSADPAPAPQEHVGQLARATFGGARLT